LSLWIQLFSLLLERSPQVVRAIKRHAASHRNSNSAKTTAGIREKWKKVRAQGRIAITIDEDGQVSEAKLLEASPKEAPTLC